MAVLYACTCKAYKSLCPLSACALHMVLPVAHPALYCWVGHSLRQLVSAELVQRVESGRWRMLLNSSVSQL